MLKDIGKFLSDNGALLMTGLLGSMYFFGANPMTLIGAGVTGLLVVAAAMTANRSPLGEGTQAAAPSTPARERGNSREPGQQPSNDLPSLTWEASLNAPSLDGVCLDEQRGDEVEMPQHLPPLSAPPGVGR